ncbi:DNA polymerase III subunit gamma/tau [Marinobacter sp.]|uniref:DNA polymerase III subunit gamma/tau n=1 Tax=Marinobacter sp. TaxID=50741 RepID=UPI00384D79BD
MSYQVLARKWRPQTFEDMVGQEHVLQALIHALENQRLHHAYLFTGTRGVGKTTIGRLLARCLNCEAGISPRPCGECSSCREIMDGRFVDLIEIDAASRTGVDDMRELTDNVQYSPSRGRFKVYLIDEVHMLSTPAFNAFLKTLEEPPEHVKFLLATTDPQKLPVTVLSRCLQFNLKRMTPEHIAGHLRHVLTSEEIPFEEPALWQLARAADGSMRDALSLTDQAIAYGNQKLASNDVSSMLGTIDQRDIAQLVNTLAHNDGPALLSEIARISEFAPDYSAILTDLLSLFHRVTMEQVVPGTADNAMGDADQVQTLARQLSAEDAQLFYQAALMGRKDLAITPDARMGFEMALLRMLAFRPGADRREPPAAAAPRARAEASEEPDPAKKTTAAGKDEPARESASSAQPSSAGPAQPLRPEPEPESAVEPANGPAPESGGSVESATPQEAGQPPRADEEPPFSDQAAWVDSLPVSEEVSETRPSQASATIEQPVAVAAEEFSWPRDFRSLGVVGMPGNLASNAAFQKNENQVTLTLDQGHARLLTSRHRGMIREALTGFFDEEIQLEVIEGSPGHQTPAIFEENARRARQQAAEDAIRSDPLVQSIVERFEGRVVEGSIRPAEQP